MLTCYLLANETLKVITSSLLGCFTITSASRHVIRIPISLKTGGSGGGRGRLVAILTSNPQIDLGILLCPESPNHENLKRQLQPHPEEAKKARKMLAITERITLKEFRKNYLLLPTTRSVLCVKTHAFLFELSTNNHNHFVQQDQDKININNTSFP